MPELKRSDRPLTGPFWAAIDRGLLTRPLCNACGRSHFSPQVVCPWCQSSDWSYQVSSGRGVVYSYTVVHRPPEPGLSAPYVVADIEMDEGWRMFSWITDCDPTEVTVAMVVEVSFEPGSDGEMLPAFIPAADIPADGMAAPA